MIPERAVAATTTETRRPMMPLLLYMIGATKPDPRSVPDTEGIKNDAAETEKKEPCGGRE